MKNCRDYDFDHKIYHKLPTLTLGSDSFGLLTYMKVCPAAQMKFEDWAQETFGPYLDEFHMPKPAI